jgi:hypothetical protein
MARNIRFENLFRWLNFSTEIIQLVVTLYLR